MNLIQCGRTALHLSADSKCEGKDKMSLLVGNGADVDAQDDVSFNLNEKDKTDISMYRFAHGRFMLSSFVHRLTFLCCAIFT